MKRICIVFMLCFLSIGLYAQEEQKKKYEAYCEVVGYEDISRFREVNIVIDGKKYDVVKDGEQIKSKSATQVMRFLSEKGWKLKSYALNGSSGLLPVRHYYIMVKEVTSEEEITQGLKEK